MRVRAKARGYDGVTVREVGDEFDFNGKLGSWMEPVDGSASGGDKSGDQAKSKKGDKAAA